MFINQRSTRGNDDAYVFMHLIEGISKKETYAEMREKTYAFYDNSHTKYTKPENNLDTKHHDRENMIWPDQRIGLKYQDTDRDGIDDYKDSEFTISYEELQVYDRVEFDLSGATKLPQRNLSSVNSFVYSRFLSSLSLFRNIRFPVKDKGVGWFNKYEGEYARRMNREDIGDEVIKVSEIQIEYDRNEQIYYFDLEVSAAYKHCSDRVLKALVCYELSDYFLKNYQVTENGQPVRREKPLENIE